MSRKRTDRSCLPGRGVGGESGEIDHRSYDPIGTEGV